MKTRSVTFDFTEQRVLVTGGTSGIGHAVALAFRDAGAEVVVTGTQSSTDAYGVDLDGVSYHQCRMDDRASVDSVIASCPEIDVVINNAGANLPDGRDENDPEVFETCLRINLTGAQRLTQGLLSPLRQSAQRGGAAAVVNVVSLASTLGVAIVPGYSAAKAALAGLTRAWAVAWAPAIRVNAVAPGLIETRMTEPMMGFESMTAPMLDRNPMSRFGVPADIAPTILFLSARETSYVTGQVWTIDGGYSIVG